MAAVHAILKLLTKDYSWLFATCLVLWGAAFTVLADQVRYRYRRWHVKRDSELRIESSARWMKRAEFWAPVVAMVFLLVLFQIHQQIPEVRKMIADGKIPTEPIKKG